MASYFAMYLFGVFSVLIVTKFLAYHYMADFIKIISADLLAYSRVFFTEAIAIKKLKNDMIKHMKIATKGSVRHDKEALISIKNNLNNSYSELIGKRYGALAHKEEWEQFFKSLEKAVNNIG
tara:strand:- start:462 stop:827 length:366 start_codon:yes stop_codon:yes gene_type:complete